MDRRAFMAGTTTAVAFTAGCLASGESGSDDDPSNESNDDESDDSKKDPSEEQQPYTVVGDDTTESSPLQHEVTVRDGDLHSPESPLRVEVTVTNTSDETLTYGERRETLFWGNRSENGFTLLPELDSETTSAIREFDTESAYWIATSPFVTTDDYQVGSLEPDESHSETLSVVVSHQAEPPENPPTEISFTTRFHAPANVDSETESQPSEWGFTLSLDADAESYVADGGETVREFPLQYTVDVVQAEMQSTEAPMQVEVSLMNEVDEQVRYGERRAAMFWGARSDKFVLYPKQELPNESYERDTDTGVWVAKHGFAMTRDYQVETLGSGETRSETLLVLVQPDEKEAFSESLPSEMSFETTTSINQIDGESVDDVSTNWGFSIRENAE